MCGIAGIMTVSGDAPDGKELQTLIHAMAHRGPDGEGIAVSGGVGLVQTRLAIIDLETGDQPFMAAAGQGKDKGKDKGKENAALVANGIRAVVAPSFGDIHYNNCMKNGVLPVRLSRDDCDRLRQQLHDRPGAEIAFDLEAQTMTGPDGKGYAFEIDPFDKHCMLNGLDDIAVTLEYEDQITAFEGSHAKAYDWLY